jgi:hypothetical protein
MSMTGRPHARLADRYDRIEDRLRLTVGRMPAAVRDEWVPPWVIEETLADFRHGRSVLSGMDAWRMAALAMLRCEGSTRRLRDVLREADEASALALPWGEG